MDLNINHWKDAIETMMNHVKYYEDALLKIKALECVPKAEIAVKAFQQLNLIVNSNSSDDEANRLILYEKYYLQELVRWFKNKFFTWYTAPYCLSCKVLFKYMGTEKDEYEGALLDVEYYICEICNSYSLFPRFFNPRTLLRLRAGRSTEWAQCFGMICSALGWETRYVQDVTDHVWTEIYSHIQRRWIHIDCCEGIIDKPLMYELGWKKKLSYVLAFSPYDVQDVTWRYTSDHIAVQKRRSFIGDSILLNFMLATRKKLQSSMSKAKVEFLNLRLARELGELMCQPTASGTYEGMNSVPLKLSQMNTELNDNTNHLYVWTPSPTDVTSKQIKIKFNLTSNSYQVGRKQVFDWDTLTYSSLNIFRKVETHRKKSYLSIIENADEAVVSWCIDVSKTKLLIDEIHVKCPTLAIKKGLVCWAISKVVRPIEATRDRGAYFLNTKHGIIPPLLRRRICNIAPSSTTTLYYSDGPSFVSKFNEDVNKIFISVTLLKGHQWPYAQIFVQNINDEEFDNGFIVYLK